MRRLTLTGAIALAAASGGVTLTAAAAQPPRAMLEGLVCRRAANPLDRAFAVTAVMRPLAGTESLALKFQLEREAAGAGSFSQVRGGDLGRWRHPTSPPNLGQRPQDVWRLKKEVVNLAGPAVYRFRVVFQWTGRARRVIGRAVRLSARCDEPQ